MDQRRDYHFDLPPAQIAQVPADRRDASRLLIVGDTLADRQFPDLLEALPPDPVVIVNDARVIPARVMSHKDSGGRVELLFVEPTADPSVWRCLARARRPLRKGQILRTAAGDLELASDREPVTGTIDVRVPGDVFAFLDQIGELPLPPYINRDAATDPATTIADRERYQTVYARVPGAVAAPTAGLHLTPALLDAIRARGGTIASVTLHVGLGTFAPMRADRIADHVMHEERFDIPAETAALVASGRPIVAIGTTVVRALESAALGDHRVATGPGATRLFVHPHSGHRFQVVDHLVTNFHLPESTLLMLVCAFAGTERIFAAYRHAVAAGYRFFSYGDAMFVRREAP
ncbi:MAG: tRNA preQ1(34) S-adenosylmethionine ribosyltransferase-isomerase QueA [Deltaproteobacteria bacterium]|nr:tRNA preQ1(34) S-adenosylmethionine ribosyltransferase-isomerase QueA [Deltaproteobacteria bacterium]